MSYESFTFRPKRGESTQKVYDSLRYMREPHPQPPAVKGKGDCPRCGKYYAKGLHLHYKHCGLEGDGSK